MKPRPGKTYRAERRNAARELRQWSAIFDMPKSSWAGAVATVNETVARMLKRDRRNRK